MTDVELKAMKAHTEALNAHTQAMENLTDMLAYIVREGLVGKIEAAANIAKSAAEKTDTASQIMARSTEIYQEVSEANRSAVNRLLANR